jgi:riboflavin kinase / FMN adenylyltransferase
MMWRSLEEVAAGFGPCALTIGNFDGVHVAHQRIMRRVVEIARENGWKAAVMTFDPHPATLVAPERAPKLLTNVDERCELIREQGIEQILILPFTPEIASLTPEEFVARILVEKLRARVVLVGDNFRFGNRAAGDVNTLRSLGLKYGFRTEVVHAVVTRRRVISSSEIRQLIQAGTVSIACRLLGRPYSVEGMVVRGHGIGSKQTVPTLNLRTPAQVLPSRGVYITSTRDLSEAREWPSITNIGYRPTFGGTDELSIETFLLAPLDGAAPEEIRIEFLRWVRPERKFESPEALKSQILHDVGRAQAYFRRRGELTESRR